MVKKPVNPAIADIIIIVIHMIDLFVRAKVIIKIQIVIVKRFIFSPGGEKLFKFAG